MEKFAVIGKRLPDKEEDFTSHTRPPHRYKPSENVSKPLIPRCEEYISANDRGVEGWRLK